LNNRFAIAFKLIKKNIKKIVIFEAIYKLFTLAIFTPLLVEMIKIALKLSGINYLTNARFFDFLFKPTTIAILFLIILIFALFSLMEMSALTYCYNISYNGGTSTVVDMIKAGAGAAVRLLGPYNAFMIVFVILLIPITHVGAISTYITSMQIPVFIIEYLKLKKKAFVIVISLVIFLSVFVVRWINVINYYTTEKMNFKNARKASVNLNRGKYIGLIISFILWQLIVLALLVSSYALITFIITKFLKIILKAKLAYTISLYGAKIIYQIWEAIYFCMIVPITCAFLSGYFFARKNSIKEERVIPVMPVRKKNSNSRFMKILSLVVVISAILNVMYINFDFGVSRGSTNVQLLKKTSIAAHRGYSSEAPENTIPAFEAAIDNMADYVELDVQETKDGTVVVLHDSNLKRVAGINENIWNVNYEDIAEVDVGNWFSEEFEGTTIPTLEEVMEVAKGRLKLNIEIKLTGHENNLEENVVRIIEEYGMEEDCVVTSFQAKALKKVKKANSEIKTGYILHVAYGDFSGVDYADALSVNYSFATETLIDEAHSAGKEVYVWTVNTADAINEMINNGADMIITDDPVLVRETILSYETNPQVVKLIKYYMKM
jgi:glycerophosphoryl diester phosphodiesterase